MRLRLISISEIDTGYTDMLSKALALAVLILNFLDARFTMLMMAHPVWSKIPEEIIELNPLWLSVINNLGVHSFMLIKTAIMVLLLGVLLISKKSFARVALAFVVGYYLNMVVIQYTHIWMFASG